MATCAPPVTVAKVKGLLDATVVPSFVNEKVKCFEELKFGIAPNEVVFIMLVLEFTP